MNDHEEGVAGLTLAYGPVQNRYCKDLVSTLVMNKLVANDLWLHNTAYGVLHLT